jgi:hypothetical protein
LKGSFLSKEYIKVRAIYPIFLFLLKLLSGFPDDRLLKSANNLPCNFEWYDQERNRRDRRVAFAR